MKLDKESNIFTDNERKVKFILINFINKKKKNKIVVPVIISILFSKFFTKKGKKSKNTMGNTRGKK